MNQGHGPHSPYTNGGQPYRHPQQHSAPAEQKSDGSKRFLNMSAGVFISLLSAVILLCCGLPLLLCALGVISAPFMPDPTISPDPFPTTTDYFSRQPGNDG